jgi:purine-binding chemotaxis protein CheW
MDLLEIRKKAKENKEAEEAKRQAAEPEAKAPEATVAWAETPAAEAPKPVQGKPSGKRKKKPVPAPAPAPEPAPVPLPSPEVGAGELAPAPAREDPSTSEDEPSDIVEYLAFMLGREEYAFKVEDVKEIIRLQQITSVPRAPDFIRGIISLRGVIIPVFDIKKRLGLDETEKTRSTRIIVVSSDGAPHGVIVDKVTGVARLRADGIEPTPAVIGGVGAEYLEGVGRLGDRLLILFNTARVSAMEGQ